MLIKQLPIEIHYFSDSSVYINVFSGVPNSASTFPLQLDYIPFKKRENISPISGILHTIIGLKSLHSRFIVFVRQSSDLVTQLFKQSDKTL